MVKYKMDNNFQERCGMREYFPSLYGNEKPKKRLGDAIIKEKLPHAFMFVGPDGSGKMTFARELAMALNCEARNSEDHPLPCGRCNTCRRIREGNFTDISYIRRQDDKATIGVEEIRHYRDDMALSPNESDRKIYIIEEADRLTENAQNALLTVLEEPPASVLIILICESADKILTTIKSRVQTVSMQRFEFDELKRLTLSLSDEAARISRKDPDGADGLIMSADGRIGRAIALFSEDEAKKRGDDRLTVRKIMDAIRKNLSYLELYSIMSELPKSRVEFVSALETLMCALRDVLLTKFDRDASLLFYISREDAVSAAREISTKRLLSIYEAVEAATCDAGRNVTLSAITAELSAKIKLL